MTHRYVRPATDLSCLREESGIGVDSSKLCLPPLWCDGYNLYDKNNGFVQKFPPLPVERRQLRKPKNRLKSRPKTWSKRLWIQMWISLGLIRETKSFTCAATFIVYRGQVPNTPAWSVAFASLWVLDCWLLLLLVITLLLPRLPISRNGFGWQIILHQFNCLRYTRQRVPIRLSLTRRD